MTHKEKKDLLVKLGLSKLAADNYLQDESDVWAVLPAFRLLKPLNDRLEFYRGPYKELIEARKTDGTLAQSMPEEAAMVAAGVSPETIQQFAYQRTLEAYESLLYQLDDHEGAEVSDVFCEEGFSKCGHARLMEADENGESTGRYLIEVHGMLPFSELY